MARVLGLSKDDAMNWIIEMIDIEAAFLNADIEKGSTLIIEWPEGMYDYRLASRDDIRDYCLKCDKAMYGAVGSSRCWFLTLIAKMKNNMGMIQSRHDPCLWYKRSPKGPIVLLVLLYVDDCVVEGEAKWVEWFKRDIQNYWNITDLGTIKKHLGVWYVFGSDKLGPYLQASMDKYM